MPLLFSCVKEQEGETESVPRAANGKVIIDGDLSLPTVEDWGWDTKAFTETPQVRRLYLVVFNEGDILDEIVKARPGTQTHPTNPEAGFSCGNRASGYLTKFHVELTGVHQGNRYIHFIATSLPIALLESGDIDMVDEAAFVSDLVTSGAVVAYWGRREFTEISATTDMSGIKMIRNFSKAKVKVAEGVDNFEILGFKVFNTPVYGTIAPFNSHTPDYIEDQINFNRFADYARAANESRPYSYLNGSTGYTGFMPSNLAVDNLATHYNQDGTDDITWVNPANPEYFYERSYRDDNNPFIILKANYTDANDVTDTYYYKADFVYQDENGDNVYYDLLRNFQFTLNITGVSGKGSSSVYEAVHSIALNNFEGSTMSQELTNIANDDSRLFVSKTDILLTRGDSFTMYVRSLKGAGLDEDDNDSIVADVRIPTAGYNIVANSSSIDIAAENEDDGEYEGWRKVTVTIANAANLNPGEVWKQPIIFKNNDGNGLSRTVNLTLRRPMTLTVDAQDVVPGTEGSDCEVKFSIPAGLTIYRFPMYFYIEQEKNTLYPAALAANADEALSVESGHTQIPDGSGNSYYYRRTLTWNEYYNTPTDVNGIKTFSCYFKTLEDASATTVWIVPHEDNNYYDPFDHVENEYTNKDSFLNSKIAGEVTFPYYGLQLAVGTKATVAATGNSDAAITYSSSNTSVATVDEKGEVTAVAAGTATITASLAESSSYTADTDSYTVYVTSDELCELELHWYNEPTYVLKVGETISAPAALASVAAGYDSANVTITYTATPAGKVTIDEDVLDLDITGVAAGTVTITATATAVDDDGYAGMVRSISYQLEVVTSHPESGTIYHNETFLGPTLGDYSRSLELVTDGATYNSGTDKTTLFNTYTTYNAGTDYLQRQVWYAYYNFKTEEGYGAAASAYGSTEEPTEEWNEQEGKNIWNYHNRYYASHATLVSKDIDLSCSAGATLTFYHCGNYFFNTQTNEDIYDAPAIMAGDVGVKFSNNGGTTWSDKQTIKFYPSGSNWIFVRTSVDIPAAYLTSQFRIMFDYTSTNARAGTWEIKNVLIKED